MWSALCLPSRKNRPSPFSPPEWVKSRCLTAERGPRRRVWKARAALPTSGATRPGRIDCPLFQPPIPHSVLRQQVELSVFGQRSAGPGITSRRTRPSGSGIDRESSPQHHCRQMPVLRLIGATLVVALVRAGNRGSDERGHPPGVPLRFSGGNQSQLERIHSSPFRARCSSDGNMRRQMQVAAASSGIACPKASMTSQPAYRTSLRVSKVSCQRT